MTEKSYSAIGGLFEYLNVDCGYEQWSQYLIERLSPLPDGARGIDIGCGNGYFLRAFHKAGYIMTGVDVSPQMLDRAQELALKEGIRAEFLLGDIAKLNLRGEKYDFAVSVNDCFNYIPPEKIVKALKNVCSALKKGGKFIFDVSTENKLKNIIGDNLFSEDGEDYTWIWFNKLYRDRVEMDVTLFSRRADGLYTRSDERHVQYIHTQSFLLSALKEAGFSAECEGHLGKDASERINFICAKL